MSSRDYLEGEQSWRAIEVPFKDGTYANLSIQSRDELLTAQLILIFSLFTNHIPPMLFVTLNLGNSR